MGSFSNITSVLSPFLNLAGVPGAVVGFGSQYLEQKQAREELRAQQDTALTQLQNRQKLEEATSASNSALERQRIAADAAAADERRRMALRRSVARQKALFSAQGLGGAGSGSNEAVLLGLYNDADSDAAYASQRDALRQAALDQSFSQQKQKNLLEASQLAERQNLTRIIKGY